ncbi:SDR family NAD(P)-dependent oxidoreductase [Streptomyces viridochromogenes]|nr:SDR family NAD(P)-dependent oxidoreductase [Streptomyces viridochromogenes]
MRSSPLAERTVVIIGATRGLGAAMAREAARHGARVALLGHEKAALDEVAASLPGPAPAVEADITDPAALEDAAGTIRAALGRPSAVVATAGIAEGGNCRI